MCKAQPYSFPSEPEYPRVPASSCTSPPLTGPVPPSAPLPLGSWRASGRQDPGGRPQYQQDSPSQALSQSFKSSIELHSVYSLCSSTLQVTALRPRQAMNRPSATEPTIQSHLRCEVKTGCLRDVVLSHPADLPPRGLLVIGINIRGRQYSD